MGRGQKPPPQFGQTFSKKLSTQSRQKVHSNVQIIASVDSGGSAFLQFWQTGLSSSINESVQIFIFPVIGATCASIVHNPPAQPAAFGFTTTRFRSGAEKKV